MAGLTVSGIFRGSRLAKSVAGSSNVSLTEAESRNGLMEFTGTLTGSISVSILDAEAPDGAEFLIFNNTTGDFTLTVKRVTGTGIAVAQGRKIVLHSDGTNLLSGVGLDEPVSAVSMGSDANITLTVAQAAARVLEMTSSVSLTATRNVVLPLGAGRLLVVSNQTTGAQSLVFKTAGAAGTTVASGKRAVLVGTATDWVLAAAAVP